MATHSKLGYGNSTDVDSAIENGVIDGKDLVITKDTSEFIYIRDDKTKQIIRPRERLFDTENAALVTLNTDSDTYAVQTVKILGANGKYLPYIVQKSSTGKFIIEPFAAETTGFVWQEF